MSLWPHEELLKGWVDTEGEEISTLSLQQIQRCLSTLPTALKDQTLCSIHRKDLECRYCHFPSVQWHLWMKTEKKNRTDCVVTEANRLVYGKEWGTPLGTPRKSEGTLTGKELWSQERSESQENYFSEWLRGLNKKSHMKSGAHTKYFISYISFLQVIKNCSNVLKMTHKKCVFVSVVFTEENRLTSWDLRTRIYLALRREWNQGLKNHSESNNVNKWISLQTTRFSGHSVGKNDTPHSWVHLFSPQGELLHADSQKEHLMTLIWVRGPNILPINLDRKCGTPEHKHSAPSGIQVSRCPVLLW